jgi:polyvinyl alcohol dehydrogenase (cytochrome)
VLYLPRLAVALDALTGGIVWKRYTIDEAPKVVGTTASGTRTWAPSGAAVWNSPTIDVKRRLIYDGTGDNYSAPANDRSDAVLAFDLDTGALRWVHQVLAGDVWNVACILGNDHCPAEPGPTDIGAGTLLPGVGGPGRHGNEERARDRADGTPTAGGHGV